jgi:multisubunit Na+/H+ antiporter MnhE subunit
MFWHLHQGLAAIVLFASGILIGTLLMHLMRAVVRAHARMAKFLLVVPSA